MSNYSFATTAQESESFPLRRSIATTARSETDGAALASAIARLYADSRYKHLRVRITDFGAIHLSFGSSVYHIDFPKTRLGDALRSHRYVLTAVSEKNLADDPTLTTGDSRELLWRVGLLRCTEFAVAEQAHLRLSRWPNFPTLPHTSDHLQLCALLSGRAMRLNELVAESGMSREVVRSFVVASILSGCLQASDREPDFAEEAAPPRSIARGGFFERLRRRFGLHA